MGTQCLAEKYKEDSTILVADRCGRQNWHQIVGLVHYLYLYLQMHNIIFIIIRVGIFLVTMMCAPIHVPLKYNNECFAWDSVIQF